MSKSPSRLGRGLSSLIQPTTAAPKSEDSHRNNAPGSSQIPVSVHTATRLVGGDPEAGVDAARRPLADGGRMLGGPVAGEAGLSRQSAGAALAISVPVNQIAPNSKQPRREFNRETITQLAASIARNGLVQPLVVRPVREGRYGSQPYVKYELIAGERRWRASRAAGVDEVPVIVRDVDDEKALELALIENLQREDLNAIDRAEAYSRYCREFGLKPEDVASRLNEDRTTVVNYLRLLDLPAEVKDMVASGELSMGHARAVLGATNTEDRVNLAKSAACNSLSVRALEEIVRRRRDGAAPRESATPAQGVRFRHPGQEMTAQLAHLQNQFQQALGTRVTIRPGRGKGRGKIIIEYYSLDDFDRIMDRLGVQAE